MRQKRSEIYSPFEIVFDTEAETDKEWKNRLMSETAQDLYKKSDWKEQEYLDNVIRNSGVKNVGEKGMLELVMKTGIWLNYNYPNPKPADESL